VLCLIAACAAAFGAQPRQQSVKLLHVSVPMRDGVRLYANVFLPSERARVPAILVRTPYGKGEELAPNYQALLEHGFAMMVEDVRGRYESEGEFEPLTQEPADGDDTLNWMARQPWCDGKIGMTGGSYLGIVQWKAALRANPHLKAIFSVVAGDDDYRDRFYSTGGALKLGNRLEWMSENLKTPGYHPEFNRFVWHLPLRTADVAATGRVSSMYQQALAHPAFDDFWYSISTREHLDQIRVPVFAVGGLYDNFAESDLDAFAALHKRSGLNHVLIGPWPHNMSAKFAGADFGSESAVAVRSLTIDWFDHWLNGKDTRIASSAPVRIFVMGTNKWLDDREWPPERARARNFYLASQGRANTEAGDGALEDAPRRGAAADRFTFDPRDPAPTRGGAVCCNPRVFPWGPMDQRPVEQRRDVLVFSTHPLEQDLEVVGPVKAVLYVSTNQRDTDFTAKLVDVFPDGYARNLTDGILRLRYRNSLERPEAVRPGDVYEITLDAGIASNAFLKGHRIRVEISSSNFPRFDRNPNTGGAIAGETRLVKANQTIYHDRQHPSRLVLMAM
jgi:putative CocE/NonD family hydrolase